MKKKKKMSLIAQVFLKLVSPKDVFTYIHKRSCFWKRFRTERVKESLKLLKSQERKALLSYFLISLSQLALEKVILSPIWDFSTHC